MDDELQGKSPMHDFGGNPKNETMPSEINKILQKCPFVDGQFMISCFLRLGNKILFGQL